MDQLQFSEKALANKRVNFHEYESQKKRTNNIPSKSQFVSSKPVPSEQWQSTHFQPQQKQQNVLPRPPQQGIILPSQ